LVITSFLFLRHKYSEFKQLAPPEGSDDLLPFAPPGESCVSYPILQVLAGLDLRLAETCAVKLLHRGQYVADARFGYLNGYLLQ